MTKAAGQDGKGEEAAAKGADGLYPLLMQSAAAFAAATAVGIGIQTQFARAMLGMLDRDADKGKEETAVEAPVPETKPAVSPEVKPVPAPVEAEAPVVAPKAPAPVKRAPAARKPKAAASAGDDLKRISGVGPKLEQVLNARGVRRFAEIAAWSPKDMQRFDAALGLDGRIGRDDWIGQAKALAAPVKKGK